MEGFSGLFIVLLFIAFSVLEGVGRKRKGQQKGAPGEPAAPRPTDAPSPGPRPIPPRSPSRPGDAQRPGASTRGGMPTAQGPAGAGRGEQGRASEGLVPKEIWEEILGLARGEPPKPRPVEPGPGSAPSPRPPRQEAETLEEIPPFEARSLEPLEVDRDRPSSREERRPALRESSSPQRTGALAASGGKAPLSARKGRGGVKLKEDLFGDGSPEDLRKAIILTEVLGPPLGLRE